MTVIAFNFDQLFNDVVQNCMKLTEEKWLEVVRTAPKGLGEKVLSGKRLTSSEKKLIYMIIERSEPVAQKKGRPSNILRDLTLATEDSERRTTNGNIRKGTKKDLAQLCKLPGLDNVQDRTYYAALKRGRELIAKGFRLIDRCVVVRVIGGNLRL